jgi:hypothetical protein
MPFDQSDFNALARKAAELTLETADVPRLLRLRLGPEHELSKAAEEMLGRLETFVRELRSFHDFPETNQNDNADT